MLHAYSVEQVRRAEAAVMATLPPGALMQRAAVGLAVECTRLLPRVYGASVLALVGRGDNGGDALYAAAWLARRGARVTAALMDPARAHADGLAAFRAAGGRVLALGQDAWDALGAADLVLDGITGIGGKGGLRPDAAQAAEIVESSLVPVVAVDLPSGVDADSGELPGASVRADVTVTFGTYKPGLLIDPGASRVGDCRFVDIGVEAQLVREGAEPEVEALDAADVRALLPRPERESDKYRRGVVGIAAGSAKYPGAAVLAVGAALRSGVGAVRFVGEETVSSGVLARHPEVLVSDGSPGEAGRVQAWVVGPGLGTNLMAAERLQAVLEQDVPVLIDADGLTLLKQYGQDWLRARRAPTLLTPHAGEAMRLLEGLGQRDGDGWKREQVEARRLEAVRALAERFGCTVLLKGSTTLIAEAGRRTVRVNQTGTSGLATAGSGDVLSGLAGGLMAAGLSPYDAASVGAWLHGAAAQALEAGHKARSASGAVPRGAAAQALEAGHGVRSGGGAESVGRPAPFAASDLIGALYAEVRDTRPAR